MTRARCRIHPGKPSLLLGDERIGVVSHWPGPPGAWASGPGASDDLIRLRPERHPRL